MIRIGQSSSHWQAGSANLADTCRSALSMCSLRVHSVAYSNVEEKPNPAAATRGEGEENSAAHHENYVGTRVEINLPTCANAKTAADNGC